MKIIADDKIPFLKGILEPFAEVIYIPGNKIDIQHIKDADALIIRTRTLCNEELLQHSKVKIILTATIGYDHIDTSWCEQNGIAWHNAPGCNSGSVMQYVGSALVHLSRLHHFNLQDKTLGIIGAGHVGSKVAKLAERLGMKILLNDPPRAREEKTDRFIELDDILQNSDILTLHVPLSKSGMDKTVHLINQESIKYLKPGMCFINTSRGEVVETLAIKDAISKNIISSAVLDVWEKEPDIDPELLNMADIATPHIAGYSADGKANATAMAVQAISRFFSLGMDEWFPSFIPKPENNVICIDCQNKPVEKIVEEAIIATYDISKDDKCLRQSASTFEKQRSSYPLRREYPAYRISLLHSDPIIKEKIGTLGFEII
jgi:erythronate-4-phosphate dehydrogenase